MSYCCIPKCKSDGRKKIPGISFHEIPADLELREKWIKAIARKDWTPNTTSSYTVVCSKHFLPSDFREGLKTRRLKPGVVPSVFEGRPPPSPQAVEEVNNAATPCEEPKEGQPVYVVTVTSERDADCPQLDHYVEEISIESEESGQDAAQNGDYAEVHVDAAQNGDTNGAPDDDISNGLEHAHNYAAVDPISTREDFVLSSSASRVRPCALRSVATQADVLKHVDQFKKERQRFKRKERHLAARVEKLTQAVKEYKDEMQKLMEGSHVSAFLDVVNEAENGDVTAKFILDQVANFKKKRPTWSEATVRHCIVLRGLSSSAYEYMREEKMLKLPCRGTLGDFTGGGTAAAPVGPATCASNPDSPLGEVYCSAAASPQRQGDAEADDVSTMEATVVPVGSDA